MTIARRFATFLLAPCLLLLAAGCSDNSKAAPTKAEVTVDPNLYTVDHPELFKLAKVEQRDLPTLLTADRKSVV